MNDLKLRLVSICRSAAVLALTANILIACGNKEEPAVVPSENQASCSSEMFAHFEEISRRQEAWYVQRGSPIPAPSRRPQFHVGRTSQVVVAVHGFIASPKTFNEVTAKLVDQGYTVIVPLLTGFASDPNAANSATVDDWKRSIADAIETARICDPEPSIVAHSLGAALVTDELQSGLHDIEKVVFLAPYFRPQNRFVTGIVNMLASQTDTITMDGIRRFAGNRDPYTIVPLERPAPGEAEPFVPLVAMKRVLALQTKFVEQPVPIIDGPPLYLVSSEYDNIVDSKYALEYTSLVFPTVVSTWYPKELKIGHAIQYAGGNSKFQELTNLILDYLR